MGVVPQAPHVTGDDEARPPVARGSGRGTKEETPIIHDAPASRVLSRHEAEDWSFEVYGSVAPHLVELILLAENGDVTDRYRALRALEWFDHRTTTEPARPSDIEETDGEVEDAIQALRHVLLGWSRRSRIAAAEHCGAAVLELSRRAS